MARAMYHLEAEGYVSQSIRGRYIVNTVDEVEIRNHYRSIDFGYGEAVSAMIRSMEDGSISPIIVEMIGELINTAALMKQSGNLNLDDIFLVKQYYILIIVASRNFDLMNYLLTIDKMRYSRWIAEAIDEPTQEALFGLNFQLHRNIMERRQEGAISLLSYIFEEYRRLIGIYVATRPDVDEKMPLNYDIVGQENPSNYLISPVIDSDLVSQYIQGLKGRLEGYWPHVFVDRIV